MLRTATVIGFGLMMCSCATAPPPELVDARVAYQRASSGPAASVAPQQLARAKTTLDEAESSFANDHDAPITRDLAYAAKQESYAAEAAAQAALAQSSKAHAEADLAEAQAAIREHARSAEERAYYESRAAQQAEQARQASEQQAQRAQNETATERQARIEAEQRAAVERQRAADESNARAQAEAAAEKAQQQADQAMVRVRQYAKVQDEARGRVITLNGSVLFPVGQSVLLPSARKRLDDVATALKSERNAHFLVEGYTDSRGTEQKNLRLSEARANAVREYLASRGVPDDRLEARGRGEENPVATNATAEGRANNRRVEIVISRRAAKR